MAKIPSSFQKPPKTLQEQLQILKDRGVSVADEPAACAELSRINYYRFCGYGLFFEEFSAEGKRLDRFSPGTSFERILELYRWDASLRNLLRDALSWVEIAFRSAFVYEMAISTKDPFWHLDPQWMTGKHDHAKFESECAEAARDAHEIFTKRYQEAHQSDLTPCWILAEILSFGKWSRLFGCLKHKDNLKRVSARLGAPPDDVVSWIRALVVLRNRCSHHGRLWGYSFKLRPSMTPTMQKLGWSADRVGVMAWVIADLMRKDATRRKDFVDKLKQLVAQCPEGYEKAMGLHNLEAVLR